MKYLFLVLLLLNSNVYAGNAGEKLDIKFADAETGITFQLSKVMPQLTLLSFWQVDCEACLEDMPVISVFAVQHAEVRVLGISLSDKKSTHAIWKQQAMRFPTLVNNGFPGELLKRFGNTLGAVPYTVMLDSGRQLCWSALGQVTAEQLQQGLVACRIHA